MQNNNNSVCAIVVTFHPDLYRLEALLAATLPQVQQVVVVDNGSGPEVVEWLQARQECGHLTLLALPDNMGVAAAHNRGIEWARRSGFSHLLLFDQDSIPADDMVVRLLAALHELQAQGVAVAGVGARYGDPDSGNPSYFMQYGGLKYRAVYCSDESPRHIRTEFLISSGMLIPGNMVDVIGLMDETLFIDLVDTEWCLRAADRGYKVFGVCDAVMYHSIGERLMKVWIGCWHHIPYHAPLRHYYYFRNALLVFRRCYVPAAWRRNELVQLVYMFVIFGLTATPRVGQLRMMLRGVWDGLRGRSGQYRTS